MEELPIERLSTDYQNLSDRFTKEYGDFVKQYCSIYAVRLSQAKEFLKDRITKRWGTQYPICSLHKISETNYPKCIVLGTIFKNQKLKPSVLKQLAEANSLVPQPILTHFTDESDTLFFEDDSQRYELLGIALKAKEIVTGIPCALLGTDMGKGKFMVEDYCFIDYRPQIERPILQEDMFVIFISGLDLVHVEKSMLSLRLLVMWITGLLGDIEGISTSKIVRLIIAGNSTRIFHEKPKLTISMTSRKPQPLAVIESVKVFDAVLLELCQVIEVDVMPGEHDPSNYVLPQQAMHHCMFPKAIAYKSFNQVCNPYECQIEGTRILGTSGQPIKNILAFCDIPEAIDALECCLKWNHIAPTAPDTLGCFPFYKSDPFIIEECPHVMFVGNQEKFATKICSGEEGQQVRLICIPEFVNTFTVAVLNLKNLECVPLMFKS